MDTPMPIDQRIENRIERWPVFQVRLDRNPKKLKGKVGGALFVADWVARKPLRSYDPTKPEIAEEILSEISALDVESDESLLGFVGKWGLLGLSIDEFMLTMEAERPIPKMIRTKPPLPVLDSVSQSREAFRRLKGFMRRTYAIQHGHWSDPSLPKKRGPLRDRERFHRRALANDLGLALYRYPLCAGFRDDGRINLVPVLRPRSLHGALYLELWRLIPSEKVELRRCAGCERLFTVSRTKQNRLYCSLSAGIGRSRRSTMPPSRTAERS